MQKTRLSFAILTSFLVIIFLVQPLTQMETVTANFYPHGVPTLQVHSPVSNPYLSKVPAVSISFDYYVSKDLTQVDYFSYSLDKNANSMLTSYTSDYTYNTTKYTDYSVAKTIENLPKGDHSVTFYVQFLNGTVSNFWNLTIIVDPTYKNPVPIMISPLNQTTYNTSEVPIVFTIDSSSVGVSLYSIDSFDTPNTNWQGLVGNGTLRNLPEGPHELKLIIMIGTQTDTAYVEYRETVYFNVGTASPTVAPSIPEFSWLMILPLFLSILPIVVLIRKRKVSSSK
jgi:hypothetical protein